MKQWLKARPRVATAVLASAALLLYFVGLKLLLVPVLLACMVAYLPFPKLFRSVLARLVVAGFLLYGLLLVALVTQLVVLPRTGFHAVAVLVSILVVGAVYTTARYRQPGAVPLVDRTAVAGIVVALFFAVPFAVGAGVLHRDAVGIAQFGGVQSVDGSNHFIILSEVSRSQHLEYKGGPFYPKGYHLDTAFVLDSFSLNPAKQRWGVNVRIYAVQFLLVGAAAGFILFYAARLFADLAGDAKRRLSDMWLALTLAAPLSLLYLLPLAYEGFINYSYAVATLALALVYLFAAMHQEGESDHAWRRLYLLGYLLLVFGVSWSWTLLMPPVVLIGLLALAPATVTRGTVQHALRAVFSRANALVVVAFLLQLSPLMLQLRYAASGSGSTDFFNTPGAIRIFHFGLVLAGLALVSYVALYKGFSAQLRQFVTNVFVPLYVFLGCLVLLQYFQAGELRYYTIKSAYLVEVLLMLLAAALLLRAFAAARIGWLQSRSLPVILLLCGSMLLVGLSGNPLKEVREIFRTSSGFGYPAFYESDVRQVVHIYSGNNQGFGGNVAVVHYDNQSGYVSGDMMIPGWAGAMATRAGYQSERQCFGGLYGLAMYRDVTKEQQQDFKSQVRSCASLAHQHGHEFFVVTDTASVPYLRQLFGDAVTLRY